VEINDQVLLAMRESVTNHPGPSGWWWCLEL
jgi:hypothetical protein